MRPVKKVTARLHLTSVLGCLLRGLDWFSSLLILFNFFQPLAPAVSWPNVIPSLLVSLLLPSRWACRVVTLDLMDTPAARPHHPIPIIPIAVSLTSLNPVLGSLFVMKKPVTNLLIMVTQPMLQQYRSLLPVIIRLRSLQDEKKRIHSRWRLKNNVANFMHITSRKFEHPNPIAPSQIFVALWWRKWIDMEYIEIGNRSSSAMGSLVTSVLIRTDG